MKKTLFLLFLVLVVSGTWWFSSRSEQLTEAKEEEARQVLPRNEDKSVEILNADYEKLVSHLKKENTTGKEWETIKDFSQTVESVVTEENAKNFLSLAQKNLPDFYGCLKKDFCGMTTRGEHDPYFDEERTPAHFYINRNLLFVKESLRKSSELKHLVDWSLMYDLAASDDELIQVEAFSIVKEFDEKFGDKENLIELTKKYQGTAKGEALVRLAKTSSNLDKRLIADELEEVFSSADAHTTISVLEKLGEMKLSSTQLEKVLKNLCHLKETQEHNWPVIKFEASAVYPKFETLCN